MPVSSYHKRSILYYTNELLDDNVMIEPENNANVLETDRNATISQPEDDVVELTSPADHDAPTRKTHSLPTLDMQESFQNYDQPADGHPHDSEGTKLNVDTSPGEVGAIEVMTATPEKEAKKHEEINTMLKCIMTKPTAVITKVFTIAKQALSPTSILCP